MQIMATWNFAHLNKTYSKKIENFKIKTNIRYNYIFLCATQWVTSNKL